MIEMRKLIEMRGGVFLLHGFLWLLRQEFSGDRDEESGTRFARFCFFIKKPLRIINAVKVEQEKSLASHLYLATAIVSNATKVQKKNIRASHLYLARVYCVNAAKAKQGNLMRLFPNQC